MNKKVYECSSFKEIYETLGEAWFAKVAKGILIALCLVPIVAGVVNQSLRVALIPYHWENYNIYFQAIMHAFLAPISLFYIFYLICRYKAGQKKIGETLADIKQNSPWMIFWIALLGWSFISAVISADVKTAFLGSTMPDAGWISYIYVLCVMGYGAMVASSIKVEKIIHFFIIIADILAFIMFSFEMDIPYVSLFTSATGVSVFMNSNHYGYFITMADLCIAGMFFYYLMKCKEDNSKKNRTKLYFYLISFAFHMYILMINDTMGAYLSTFIALLVLMVLWKKKAGKLSKAYWAPFGILLAMTALSAAGIITSKLGSTIGQSLAVFFEDIFKVASGAEGYREAGTNRIGLWIDAFWRIVDKPIFGYGPDVMTDGNGVWLLRMSVHNEYLECAFYNGVPGMVLYIAGLISIARRREKQLKELSWMAVISAGAVLAYLISAFFGVRMYYTVPFVFMFMGFVCNKKISAEEVAEQEEVSQALADAKETYAKLKKCKRAQEMYEVMGDERISFVSSLFMIIWCIIPVIVAFGYITTYNNCLGDSFVELTVSQIMLYYGIVCVVGFVGFLFFATMLNGKRDSQKIKLGDFFKQRKKNEIWIVLLLALFGWSFISTLLADDAVVAIMGTALKRDGFLAYIMYASVMVMAYWITSEKLKVRIINTYIAVSSVMALIMMCYEWDIPILKNMSHVSSSNVFMNPNHYGYYICMALMCEFGMFMAEILREKNEGDKALSRKAWYYLVSFAWQMYALMINDTLGAYVAVVIAMMVMIVLWKARGNRMNAAVLLPVIVTVVITAFSYFGFITNTWGETIGDCLWQFFADIFKVATRSEGYREAGTNRIMLWEEALKLIPKRPMFGYGPEGLTGAYQDLVGLDRPHNEFIQMAVFCGIPALIMYLWALVSLFINRVKNLAQVSPAGMVAAGAVIGYLISSFFGFTLYYTTPYFYMFLGMVAGSVRDRK